MDLIIVVGLILFFLWLYFEETSERDFFTGKKIYRSGVYRREKK